MAKVTGINTIITQLRKEETRRLKQLDRGLRLAALHLQAESMKIVPVDEGNLKASAFTRKAPDATREQPAYLVGYTAGYAIYVHEIPEPYRTHGEAFNIKHQDEIAAGTEHERGPTQQYKFLEKPAREQRKQLINIIKGQMT